MTEENISTETAVEAAPVITEQVQNAPAEIMESAPVDSVLTEAAPIADTTLLTEADPEKSVEAPKAETQPKAEEKISESPTGETVKTEETSQSDEPAPLPSFDAFKLPDGIPEDEEGLSAFASKLADIEVKSKADHALLQTFGQELVEMHVAKVQDILQRTAKAQVESFEKVKQEWRQNFVNDPEIGGNRQETTISSAKKFISDHGGTLEQQAEFRNILDRTGLGNHPAVIRLLANAGSAMREPAPLAASVPVKEQLSKTQKLYGKTV